jgi:hypothetical protein
MSSTQLATKAQSGPPLGRHATSTAMFGLVAGCGLLAGMVIVGLASTLSETELAAFLDNGERLYFLRLLQLSDLASGLALRHSS